MGLAWEEVVPVPGGAAAPVVSSIGPASGTIGAEVAITGRGFAGASGVRFGAAASEFSVTSSSEITATVPAGASTGPVTVTGPGGTASSPEAFTVTPGIALSVVSGPPTTTVTVAGAGFGAFEAVDVYFDITDAALASTSGTGNFAGTAVQGSGAGRHTLPQWASHRPRWRRQPEHEPRVTYGEREAPLHRITGLNSKSGRHWPRSSPTVCRSNASVRG